ncbi:MAG: hypothetical protein Q9208_004775 [Pyrenodesmia sp. 3 TL-2023]
MALRYDYSPLSEEAGEIRLLTLLPDQCDSPVRIALQIIQLTEETEFEALSYTWGSPSDPQEVIVEAKEPTTLPVTRNLFEALQHLRLRDRPRVFWIDAICVDQQNLEERSTQVLRMPDIYTQANRVVVWLGPESDNSILAMKAIDDIGSKVKVDWANESFEITSDNGSDPTSRALVDDLRPRSEIWLAFRALLSRPYFRRLWIVQEIYLAGERARIVCGSQQIPCERFFNAVFYIREQSKTTTGRHLASNAKKLGRACQMHYRNLRSLIHTTRYCQCFDERDRVYAVLSLVPEESRYGICPDYTKTVPEVFQEVALKTITASANLDILCQCSIDHRMLHLPTWVPSYSRRFKVERLHLGLPDGGAKAYTHYGSKGILTVTGFCVTTVHEIKDNLPRRVPETRDKAASTIHKLISLLDGSDDSDTHLSNLHSLCRVLCTDGFSEKLIPSGDLWPVFEEAKKYIMEVDEWSHQDSTEPPKLYQSYIIKINTTLSGRYLITTTDGRLGLAPQATEPGDKVCVILGCRSPLLLRPDGNDNYLVVGECYVDGIMTGEAILGELPKDWKLVRKSFPEQRTGRRAYLNGETGETHLRDPRLGPLPGGWSIIDHEKMNAYNRYMNKTTGENTHIDPRLEPDALRQRGVQLQEFQLI